MSFDNQPKPILEVNIQHRMGTLSLDVNFALTKPWTVLFGPSGSGKTTILRAIAGFIHPAAGRIASSDAVLLDAASRTFLPPHQRPIRTALQTPRLFPRMTVLSNILYGNGWTSKPTDAREIAAQTLNLFRLNNFEDRMPQALSGGEAQRVSVARALVSAITYPEGAENVLLLLDEPFNGLDTALRDDLLPSLQSWLTQWNIPVLHVTHDTGEAFRLGAEIIRLTEGRITQQGPVHEVLAEERTRLLILLDSAKKESTRPENLRT